MQPALHLEMRMLKVLFRLAVQKSISVVKQVFVEVKNMVDSAVETEGGVAAVGVLDIALIVGLVVVVVAIFLKCRKRKSDDNARLKDLKINAR